MSDEQTMTEHEWINVMDDMAGGPMVYKSEADEVIATLTAERDNLIYLIERYQDAITEDDNVLDHREAMFLAVRPQLKEQDDE